MKAWFVVDAHMPKIAAEPFAWGPFSDFREAERCMANLARNPRVAQANIRQLKEPKLCPDYVKDLFASAKSAKESK